MSITTEYAVKRSNTLKTGLQCIVAGVVEWAVVGRFRWYPMYIVNTIAIVLITAGVLLCLITLIARIIRTKRAELNVYNAKKYLLAFAQQYRDTRDADVANAVNAILVLRKAGILNTTAEDKKLCGTVIVDDEQHNVTEQTTDVEQNTAKVVNKKEQLRVTPKHTAVAPTHTDSPTAVGIESEKSMTNTTMSNTTMSNTTIQPKRRVVRKRVD